MAWQIDAEAMATEWTASTLCQHVHKLLSSGDKHTQAQGFAIAKGATISNSAEGPDLDASYMPRCKECLHRLSACGGKVNSVEDTAVDPCSMRMQVIVQMEAALHIVPVYAASGVAQEPMPPHGVGP